MKPSLDDDRPVKTDDRWGKEQKKRSDPFPVVTLHTSLLALITTQPYQQKKSMTSDFKKQFPIFTANPDLVYFDAASSSQTPQVVLDTMNGYYSEFRANIHRGLYDMSERASQAYAHARKSVAEFINADPGEIVFTSGTTHGLNLLAARLTKTLGSGDNIVLTRLEHHANLIPWQQAAKEYGFEIRFLELTKEYQIDEASIESLIDTQTKIVSFAFVSNTLGTLLPVATIIKKAIEVGAITIIDAAQAVAHQPIDIKALDCDFLVFSGHKMYGPTGTGVLYGKKARLQTLEPFFYGGDMIREVSYASATWADAPQKFEGGTPNIAGAIGFGAAVTFIQQIGWQTIQAHEQTLTDCLIDQLTGVPGLKIIGPAKGNNRTGVVSCNLDGVHSHDVAEILNRENIAVRSGHHCTMPLMKHLGIQGTVRASIGIYTTEEDIQKLVQGLTEVQRIFRL